MIQKEFIRNELRYRYPSLADSIRAPQQPVGRPLLFEGGGRAPGARIVVCTKEELNALPGAGQSEALFLCIGLPRAEILQANDVCVLPEGEPIGIVLNFVQRLFDRLDDWTQRLRLAAETGEDVETLLIRASEMLQNPVLLLDERGHVLAQSEQSARAFQAEMFQGDDRTGDESATGRVQKRTDGSGQEMLAVRLFSGSLRYTLVCVASERPLYATDEIVLESLAGFLRLALSERTLGLGAGRTRRENEAAAAAFRSLLRAEKPEREASEALRRLGWEASDTYAILAIEPRSGDLRAKQADAICDRLETALEGCCAFLMTPYLVAIVRSEPLANVAFRSALDEIADEHQLLIGLCEAYAGFALLPQRLEQAKRALNRAAAFEGVVSNSDVFEDELLQSAQADIPNELLCLRSVRALAQYDKEHDTEYLQTAEYYVKNRFNAVRTAGALFIHRSTFLYRLERIKEQFGLDLDDRNRSLLHLMYSLKVANTL